jgi:hypothetical protein
MLHTGLFFLFSNGWRLLAHLNRSRSAVRPCSACPANQSAVIRRAVLEPLRPSVPLEFFHRLGEHEDLWGGIKRGMSSPLSLGGTCDCKEGKTSGQENC